MMLCVWPFLIQKYIMMNDKIILGTVQMGLPYGINNKLGKIRVKDSIEILKKAYESGVRLLDSAETYGNAHQVIGNYHALYPEYKFKVITKIPPLNNIDDIDSKVEQYLHELNISKLECLMFHSFKSYKNNLNIISRIEELKENGQINMYGVSIYTNKELMELINNSTIDIIQIPFNLLDNFSNRGKLLQEARKKGIIIHTRSTFLQGLFFKNPLTKNPIVKLLKDQLIEINRIARIGEVSISTLALSYCIKQSCIDQVLIGVDSINQLQANLMAVEYQITDEVNSLINNIITEDKDLLNPALW